MGINIFRLQQNKPIMVGRIRRHADGDVAEVNTGKFDWNNLISTIGTSISSIFGGLTASKQAELYQNQQQYQSRNNNTLLWAGMAVIVVIVIVVIMVSRKK